MMNTSKYLIQNVEKYGNSAALSIKDSDGQWQTDTWNDFYHAVLDISKSLIACGVGINEKISIYSYNRREWYACYAATQLINSVAVGIYHTCSSNEVEWVVSNSDSKIVFVGNNPNDNGEIEKMPNHRLMHVIDKLDNVEFNTIFANTNTSYNPDEQGRASGKSGADVERILAFHQLGKKDPVEYVDTWKNVLEGALQLEKEYQQGVK